MELIGLIQRMNLDAQLSATGISFTVEQEYVNSTGHNIEMTFDMGLGPVRRQRSFVFFFFFFVFFNVFLSSSAWLLSDSRQQRTE